MIDATRLHAAYERGGVYALQLEVGDICRQACVYCYMNALPTAVNTLSDDDVRAILRNARSIGVTAIEWLGGEPLLRESVFSLMAEASALGFRNNIWSGGLPFEDKAVVRAAARLARFGLISVHVSTVDPQTYRALHPGADETQLDLILKGVRSLLDAGYTAEQMLDSVTLTGLQTAEDMIRTIDYFEERFRIRTSLNVYHTYLRPGTPPGELQRFIPSRRTVAMVSARVARQWGERRLPMNCVDKEYCSATIAVLCDGSVTPCATIRPADAPNIRRDGELAGIYEKHRDWLTLAPMRDGSRLPSACATCVLGDRCWGCRSRSYAAGNGLYGEDPRCFRRSDPDVPSAS